MFRGATAAALLLFGAACDPILNVQGSFFPAWMVAMIIGIALTAAVRYLFVVARLEPHLGPPLLIYPSLERFLLWSPGSCCIGPDACTTASAPSRPAGSSAGASAP